LHNWLRPQGLFPLLPRGLVVSLAYTSRVPLGGLSFSTPAFTHPTRQALALLGAARRAVGVGPVDRFTVLAVLAGLLLAVGAARALETHLTDLLLQRTAERAADQVRLGLLPRLSADDFAPPYPPAKLAALEQRLEPFLARMREDGSGLIRLHIHAQDGTILYSDNPALLGQVVAPTSVPLLAQALAGSQGTEFSPLVDPDDADLVVRYDRALKVHVPLVLDGQVVGAFQLYEDPAGLRPLPVLLWSAEAGVFGLMLLLLSYRARHVARAQGPQAGAPPAPAPAVGAPPSPALVLAEAAEAGLTPREREVLALMAANFTYREIAVQLVLSEGTVRTHAKNILRKLHQPDRAQAVIAAMRTGLLQLPSSSSIDVARSLPPDAERGAGGVRSIQDALVSSAGR
jgi:DNA-binding CsgD family transcriptional regulator